MGYVIFSHADMANYIKLAGFVKNKLSMLPEIPIWFFSPNTTHARKDTYIDQKPLASALLHDDEDDDDDDDDDELFLWYGGRPTKVV